MFATPAYAQAAGASGAAAFTQFIPLVLIFVIMYFLILRPQQKRAKQHRTMIEALSRGDHVITQGGLIGKVSDLKPDEVTLEIAQNVKVRVVRSTIAQVVSPTAPAANN